MNTVRGGLRGGGHGGCGAGGGALEGCFIATVCFHASAIYLLPPEKRL